MIRVDRSHLVNDHHPLPGLLAALVLLAALAAVPVRAQEAAEPMAVIQVVGERVDVSVSDEQPIGVGMRLVVERGDELVAELEVLIASTRSASCRIERKLQEVAVGDTVRPLRPRSRPGAAPLAAAAAEAISPAEPAPAPAAPRVRQVLAEAVYLDSGRSAGLAQGQRLEVMREGAVIAVLEIEHIASRSASCRVISATGTIQPGDAVVPGPLPPGAVAAVEPAPGSGASSSGAREPKRTARKAPAEPLWADLSGSVALRVQAFQDGSDAGRDLTQTAAIINLNARHLGGSPHQFRLRMRGGQDRITRTSGSTETRPNERLYEMSLLYEPPEGRISYQLGRLAAGPQVGFDYLDGVLGEVRLKPNHAVGAFYGRRSRVEDLALDGTGQAYGAFFHYQRRKPEEPFYAEVVVAGIGEYRGGEVNREFLSIYGSQGSGSRWSLYERVEVDFNRNWRQDSTGASQQLSNLLLAATYSVNKSLRLGLSYDERRQILTLDDRETPESRFDDALREGLRLSAYFGSGKGLRGNASVGLRRRQGSPEESLTYNGSLYHSNVFGWNLLVGADYSAFSGETSDGQRVGIRFQKYFKSGHDLELNLGRATTTIGLTGEERQSQWIRLSGTAQLGRRFFLLGEIESTQGDDAAGERLFLQLGYRL
ncbi:MAG TPA: hypothetical protein VF017_12260 [Thermoanaerobaculia bacterium]|nr:hypothetical protein [Thermoanaerobaculia bacterium]